MATPRRRKFFHPYKIQRKYLQIHILYPKTLYIVFDRDILNSPCSYLPKQELELITRTRITCIKIRITHGYFENK
jgi:hypothetical protein